MKLLSLIMDLICRKKRKIILTLPEQLARVLEIYLQGPWHTICSHQDTDRKHVFLDNKGRAMTKSAHMTLYWQQLLRRMNAPFNFSPHK